jgi:hypothetical protein
MMSSAEHIAYRREMRNAYILVRKAEKREYFRHAHMRDKTERILKEIGYDIFLLDSAGSE